MYNQVPWQMMQGADPANGGMRQGLPPRTRAMTSAPHPQALFPAHRPSTVHRPDIFFAAPVSNNASPVPPARPPPVPYPRPMTSPKSPSRHPFADQSTFYRSLTCPPPIPPKPSELQQGQPEIHSSHQSNVLPQTLPTDSQEVPSEDPDLALALEISQSESKNQPPTNDQEDEDLARALQESLNLSNVDGSSGPPSLRIHTLLHSTELSGTVSGIPEEPETPMPPPLESPQTPTFSSSTILRARADSDSNGNNNSSGEDASGSRGTATASTQPGDDLCANDEAFARILADSDGDPIDDACANDENIARRLAEEDEPASTGSANHDVAQMRRNDLSAWTGRSQARASSVFVVDNEEYSRRLLLRGKDTNSTLRGRSKSAMATLNTAPPGAQDLPPPYDDSHSVPTNGTTSGTAMSNPPHGHSTVVESPVVETHLPRTNSSPIVAGPSQSFAGALQHTHLVARTTSLSSLNDEEEPYEDPSSPSATPNPYISDDLLRGVSIGFEPPLMTSHLATWGRPLPTIISLPYGRSLPLHIQAASWRHMLQLFARLPGTTIQATVEALAETKTEHRLRTVVQFVKPHLASTEWRCICWFTLEHSVPSDVTGSTRYVNDVNVLPWSYTFSPPPQLLRGGPDSRLTKTYTIPVTGSLPFPKLPISFPDLAMYLHASLEVSRRHINDSSSGVRKLAKMVDVCYPDTNNHETDDSERRGVGGFFKKVVGRTGRRRGGNEETYDLVTPFVADEWG